MADGQSGEQESFLSSNEDQQTQEDTKISRKSAELLVISDDDDEIEIVKVKTRRQEPKAADRETNKELSKNQLGSESPRDQTCSVCLGEFDNKAFLDQCFRIL